MYISECESAIIRTGKHYFLASHLNPSACAHLRQSFQHTIPLDSRLDYTDTWICSDSVSGCWCRVMPKTLSHGLPRPYGSASRTIPRNSTYPLDLFDPRHPQHLKLAAWTRRTCGYAYLMYPSCPYHDENERASPCPPRPLQNPQPVAGLIAMDGFPVSIHAVIDRSNGSYEIRRRMDASMSCIREVVAELCLEMPP